MTEREFALALAGFARLGRAQVGAQSLALKAAVGNRSAIGPRDPAATPSLLSGRLKRALRNVPETAPVLLALMPALHAAAGRKPRAAPGILARPPAPASRLPRRRPLRWRMAPSGLALTLTGVLLP